MSAPLHASPMKPVATSTHKHGKKRDARETDDISVDDVRQFLSPLKRGGGPSSVATKGPAGQVDKRYAYQGSVTSLRSVMQATDKELADLDTGFFGRYDFNLAFPLGSHVCCMI